MPAGTTSRAGSPTGTGSRTSRGLQNGISHSGKAPEQIAPALPLPPPPSSLAGVIPGVNGPIPALPGFRKKKKEKEAE